MRLTLRQRELRELRLLGLLEGLLGRREGLGLLELLVLRLGKLLVRLLLELLGLLRLELSLGELLLLLRMGLDLLGLGEGWLLENDTLLQEDPEESLLLEVKTEIT